MVNPIVGVYISISPTQGVYTLASCQVRVNRYPSRTVEITEFLQISLMFGEGKRSKGCFVFLGVDTSKTF